MRNRQKLRISGHKKKKKSDWPYLDPALWPSIYSDISRTYVGSFNNANYSWVSVYNSVIISVCM
jgi:hypothetical protein